MSSDMKRSKAASAEGLPKPSPTPMGSMAGGSDLGSTSARSRPAAAATVVVATGWGSRLLTTCSAWPRRSSRGQPGATSTGAGGATWRGASRACPGPRAAQAVGALGHLQHLGGGQADAGPELVADLFEGHGLGGHGQAEGLQLGGLVLDPLPLLAHLHALVGVAALGLFTGLLDHVEGLVAGLADELVGVGLGLGHDPGGPVAGVGDGGVGGVLGQGQGALEGLAGRLGVPGAALPVTDLGLQDVDVGLGLAQPADERDHLAAQPTEELGDVAGVVPAPLGDPEGWAPRTADEWSRR